MILLNSVSRAVLFVLPMFLLVFVGEVPFFLLLRAPPTPGEGALLASNLLRLDGLRSAFRRRPPTTYHSDGLGRSPTSPIWSNPSQSGWKFGHSEARRMGRWKRWASWRHGALI